MPLIPSLINWVNIKRFHQIELMRKYPENVQNETFQKLLNKAKDTEWGKKYGYSDITQYKTFTDRVPINRYDDIKPFINRHRQGEIDVLWPGEIKWFAKSSGTTADKSKFIPVSKESLEDTHFRGGKDILAIYSNNYPETELFKGKSLTLGGSHKIDRVNNQSFYGDLSAILIETLPFWADFRRTPKTEVALIEDFEEKLDKLTREALRENVTSIAGTPSWNLVMINYVLDFTGKKNLLEVWPNLELFVHGGVSFLPYREQFRKLIPSDNMHYLETYNASEGFFAIQDDPLKDDMLLILDLGIFYEFIPLEELNTENPRSYTIGEVEMNKNYAMIISTNGGLWRYIIGDTVKFTSLYPHKIKITGRTRHFINVFGEELMVENAENALKIACEKTNADVSDYTAAPVFMDGKESGAHEWLIEFSNEPADLEYFGSVLDRTLMSLNSDYEAKRYKNLTLGNPILHKASRGTFYEWLNQRNKLGGQNKIPRLSNSREYLEDLLVIHKKLASGE